MYIGRRGFLDGRAGLDYCAMIAFYEYMIDLKVREQQRREQEESADEAPAIHHGP